jgi:hypothetical protein
MAVEKKVNRGRRPGYNVSAEQFIKVWQAAHSTEEVATKLGMPKPIVHARASMYRKKGIALKKLTSNGGLDVDAMNLLILKIDADEKGIAPATPEVAAVQRPKVPSSKSGK